MMRTTALITAPAGVPGRTLAPHALHMSCPAVPLATCRLAQPSRRADLSARSAPPSVRPIGEVEAMAPFLDSLKWDKNNLVVAIAQHVDTGEVLMQAFADREAINETLQTG